MERSYIIVSNSEVIKKVTEWITFADEDLVFAQNGLNIKKNTPFRLIAFHSQQCVEKYLKAFLVLKGVDFPFTHIISFLLKLCSEHANWIEDIKVAEGLTQFAISLRYPGEDKGVTREEAVEAIFIASKVREVVRKDLIKNGVNL